MRVQISAGFYPNFSRNLQSGASEVNSAEVKKATIRVYHSLKYPSQAVLPVVEAR